MDAHKRGKGRLERVDQEQQLDRARRPRAAHAQAVHGVQHDGQGEEHLDEQEQANPGVVAGGCGGRPLREGIVVRGNVVRMQLL